MSKEYKEVIEIAEYFVKHFPIYPRSVESVFLKRGYELGCELRKQGYSNFSIAKKLRSNSKTNSSLFISSLKYGDCREMRRIKREVLERDGYKCKSCGKKGLLHVHHKNKECDHSKKNLITLCPSCHKKEDMERWKR
jgi:5-methylcytosine-specific restriction endonuclease McrA